MSKIGAMFKAQADAKAAAEAAEAERTRTRSFDTRAQPEGNTYTHGALEDDEKETLGGGPRRKSASRAILG